MPLSISLLGPPLTLFLLFNAVRAVIDLAAHVHIHITRTGPLIKQRFVPRQIPKA